MCRYLEDLYTLTYDEDSSIDQDNYEDPAEEAVMKKIPTGLTSLQVIANITIFRGRQEYFYN